MTEWIYRNRPYRNPDISIWTGYVYRIDNLKTGDFYVGKKSFTNKVGKKRVQKWQNYWGSSEELQADLERYGPSNFKRTILKLCTHKSQMNYWEVKYQIKYRCLERDDCYNKWINCKIYKVEVLRK